MSNKKLFRFEVGYDKDKWRVKERMGHIVADDKDSAITELENRYPETNPFYGERFIHVMLITKAKGNINEFKSEIQELQEKMKEKIKLFEDWTGEKYENKNNITRNP